jgi:hypothetical protein
MLIYEDFVPLRDIPRKKHVIRTSRAILMTRTAKERLAQVSQYSPSDLLFALDHHGIEISSGEDFLGKYV